MLLWCSYIYHIVYLCHCWYFSIKSECYRLVKISMRFVKLFDTVGIWWMVKHFNNNNNNNNNNKEVLALCCDES